MYRVSFLIVRAHASHTQIPLDQQHRPDEFDSSCLVPLVVPILGNLDHARRLLRGDFYVGRGCKQRGLQRSLYANDYKVSV